MMNSNNFIICIAEFKNESQKAISFQKSLLGLQYESKMKPNKTVVCISAAER